MANERQENAYAYSYHTNYIRNARAIAIAWGIFTFCFAIIMIILFVEASWMYGATQGMGTFGLWQYCRQSSSSLNTQDCGNDFWPNSNGKFAYPGESTSMRVATIFMLIAVCLVGLSIMSMLLFLCKTPKTPTVFIITGVLQILCGVCVLSAVIAFVIGKRKASNVTNQATLVCGSDGESCALGWAFILAVVAVLDAVALGILSLILANKQEKLDKDPRTYSEYSRPNGSAAGRGYGTLDSARKSRSRTSLNSSAVAHNRKSGGSIADSRRSVGSGESEAEIGMDATDGGPEPTYASVTPKSERSNGTAGGGSRAAAPGDTGSVGSQSNRSRSSRRSEPYDVHV